jgi:hypothetical protein
MDVKRKHVIFEPGRKNIYFPTYPPPTAIQEHRNLQHRSLLTVVSATSNPPFQPLRHQRNVCHSVVNCFTWQTLPTVKRKYFFINILCIESFCPSKTHNRTLLFDSILLKHRRHLGCHEAGLCCYLVIHIENLLRTLQLFYFYLWPIYWLSLALLQRFTCSDWGKAVKASVRISQHDLSITQREC